MRRCMCTAVVGGSIYNSDDPGGYAKRGVGDEFGCRVERIDVSADEQRVLAQQRALDRS